MRYACMRISCECYSGAPLICQWRYTRLVARKVHHWENMFGVCPTNHRVLLDIPEQNRADGNCPFADVALLPISKEQF